MRANQRGWMFATVHGSTSAHRRSTAASGSPGASGAGAPRASRSATAADLHRSLLADHAVAEAPHVLGRQLQRAGHGAIFYWIRGGCDACAKPSAGRQEAQPLIEDRGEAALERARQHV